MVICKKVGFIVDRYTLFMNMGNKMFEYPLYDIEDRHVEIPLQKYGYTGVLRLEVWDNEWIILEDEGVNLYVNKHQVSEVNMTDKLVVLVRCGSAQFSLLVRSISADLTVFNKYVITGVNEVSVGSSNLNTISVRSGFIATKHFIMQNQNGVCRIGVINNSPTYLNGVRIDGISRNLVIGDVILFADIKMLFLGSIIAFNHVSELVSTLPVMTSRDAPEGVINYLSEVKFSRIPRLMEPLDDEDIDIEAPPTQAQPDDTPWIFTIGPAVTMPIPMLLSMVWRMSGGSSKGMMIAMVVSMLGSSLLGLVWGIARRKYQEKKRIRDEERRVDRYTKYIDKNTKLLQDKQNHNATILRNQYLSCSDLFLEENRKNIWNRNVHHTDFLTIRLGTGCAENPYKISVPEERFSMFDDDLAEVPREVAKKFEFIPDVPALVDLRANPIVGIIGDENRVHAVIRVMLTQITALHSYNDVNVVILYNENKGVNYDWVRWYPHTFIKDKSLRLVASNKDDMTNVMGYMQNVLRSRKEAIDDEEGTSAGAADTSKGGALPHFVVFCLDEEMLDISAFSKYFDQKYNLGVTFVLGFNDISSLPNECNAIIQIDKGYTGFYNLDAVRKETNAISFEYIDEQQAEMFARSLMAINLKEFTSGGGNIPNYVDFMGLIHVGDLEKYPLAKRYRENRAYESIRAVMGIGEGGKEQILDLNEKKHGPHGLVAGTTGSGKSETLQTIILSWMMNYSPDEVAFVLIDYKGGGMANSFIGSPHVAGTITNISDGEDDEEEGATDTLDQNQTRRALIAIKSEIKRRQKIFKKNNVNHVDQYMRLYRKGQVSEPLPHLIMISDEFAELKQQQPEFIKELVSAARVGRSLGVHLILATQKPSNSVDDEIWANSRFKICLRVQDKADSNGMLHRPEAAFLTKTGRGYFQLGNDEIFEEFQSGYSGGVYEPKDIVDVPEDTECRMIELDGTDTYIEHEHKEKREDSKTQLAACVEYITKMSERIGYKPARQLWAPQLKRKMYLDEVFDFCARANFSFTNGLQGVCGFVDDPEKQTQYPLSFDFLNMTNLLLFGQPGCGKTTFLKTLITSMVTMYSPEQFQFYVLDFSSRTMKMFKKLPHCGDVVFEDDGEEYIKRLFQLLLGFVEERKRLFGDLNVGSINDYLAIKQLPIIVLFIDNIYPFKETLANYGTALDTLVRSSKYGIQVVATVGKENEINSRLRQNFLTTVCLSMNERIDYRTALGTPVSFTPSPYKGRGMCVNGGNALEFHTALPVRGTNEIERSKNLVQFIAEHCQNITSKVVATPIPILPKGECYSVFFDKFNSNKTLIPIGYNSVDIRPVYIDLNSVFCLSLSDGYAGMKSVATCMRNIIYAAQNMGHSIHYIQMRNSIRINGVKIDNLYKTYEQLQNFLPMLHGIFAERSKMFMKWQEQHPDIKDKFAEHIDEILPAEHIIIIVDDMQDFFQFCTSMDANVRNYNKNFNNCFMSYLNECSVIYRVHFIMGLGASEFSTVLQGAHGNLARAFMQYRMGMHFGGNLNSVPTFDSNLGYKEKGLNYDSNVGNTLINGRDINFVMPMELE